MAEDEVIHYKPGSKRGSTTWVVNYGDTLTQISVAIFGTKDRWMWIYNANRNLIHNPDSLKAIVGFTLKIPEITDKATTADTAVAYSHKGAKEWTIQYGDTLSGISKAVYGTPDLWNIILEENFDAIDDQNSLKELVGYALQLPQDPNAESIAPTELTKGAGKGQRYSYSLQIVHGDIAFEPAVEEDVTIEWDRGGVPGKLEFTVLKYATSSYSEGDQVKFYYNKNLLFVGYVFTKQRDKNGHIKTVAYDQTRYLKNKFAYVFEDKTSSEILQELCDDFGLEVGDLEDSEFKIPAIAEENSEAFDIILSATEETLANTGEMYVLYDNNGKIEYKNVLNMKSETLIRADTAEDFDYKTSIDDETYNRIILYYKPASKPNFGDGGDFGGSGSGINAGGQLPPWVLQQQNMGVPHANGGGIEYNCTWYAGDRVQQLVGPVLTINMGDGGMWAANAESLGFSTYYGTPFVGAGACMIGGVTQGVSWLSSYGHIAIVEDVYEDGSMLCSEFYGAQYSDGGILHTNVYSALTASTTTFIDFGIRVNSTSSISNYALPLNNQITTYATKDASTGVVVGSNVTRWSDLIIQSATRHGLAADFVAAIIFHESSGMPNVVSSSGAMGLMQLMPRTAGAMGVSNAFDPAENIEGGCKYFEYLKNLSGVNGNLQKMMRGYAGGETRVNDSSLDGYYYEVMALIPNELTGMSGSTTAYNGIEDGDNAKLEVYKAEDPDSIKRWGVLQYFESVDTPGIGQDKADSMLELYNRKTRQFTIKKAIGDPTVRGGTMIPVSLDIGDIMINNYMLVSKVTHHFYRDSHTMDLELEGAYDE